MEYDGAGIEIVQSSDICKECGKYIHTMTYRGTGYCSDICTRAATNIEEVRSAEKVRHGERSNR